MIISEESFFPPCHTLLYLLCEHSNLFILFCKIQFPSNIKVYEGKSDVCLIMSQMKKTSPDHLKYCFYTKCKIPLYFTLLLIVIWICKVTSSSLIHQYVLYRDGKVLYSQFYLRLFIFKVKSFNRLMVQIEIYQWTKYISLLIGLSRNFVYVFIDEVWLFWKLN